MTPKEKADQLYEAFFYSIPSFTDEGQLEHKTAKQCALIAVDFHLKEFEDWANITCCGESFSWKYWKEVKKEIENL